MDKVNSCSDHPELVAMALLLRGEMHFLWQKRDEALKDLDKVADMSDVHKEVGVLTGVMSLHITIDTDKR